MLSWLFKSLLWCHRITVASVKSKQTLYITYFINLFQSQYWSSLHSPHFIWWWHWLRHCATLVRNFLTSILVRAAASLCQSFWGHYGLSISNAAGSRTFPFLRLSWLDNSCCIVDGRSCQTTSKILSSSLKKRHF